MKPRHLLIIVALAALAWAATSCTVSTPGSTMTVDGPSAWKIARIIAEK